MLVTVPRYVVIGPQPPGLFPAAKATSISTWRSCRPLVTSRGAGASGSSVKATLASFDRNSHSHANGSFPCADFGTPALASTGEIRLMVQAEEEWVMQVWGSTRQSRSLTAQ